VTRPGEEDLLAARAETRASYRAVIDRAGTWRLPRIVRDSLRVWQYEQADELLVGANRALDRRDEVRAAAKAAGLATPDTMRLVFEGPAGFAGVSAEADAELAAIATYQSAAATKPVSESALQAIGLWNSTPDASLDQAAEAFATGDLRGTVAAAAFARTTWETSGDIGRNRVLAVTASVAAVLLALWLLFRWLRDRGGRGRRLHRTVANRGPVGEG
jgi:hypothetical protein